jgi:hypothetical protein
LPVLLAAQAMHCSRKLLLLQQLLLLHLYMAVASCVTSLKLRVIAGYMEKLHQQRPALRVRLQQGKSRLEAGRMTGVLEFHAKFMAAVAQGKGKGRVETRSTP